jgi:hypothetical protein
MKLLATLDVETAASDADDAIELAEPRRLVEVDVDPPKPVNPSVDIAGRDSSGNNNPVLVIFESHIRWYLASFCPLPVPACSSSSIGRLEAPTLAAFAAVSWRLSPWKRGQERAVATDLEIWTLPAVAVEAVMRIIYFEGMGAEEEGSGLEGRRWSIACGVWGRGG